MGDFTTYKVLYVCNDGSLFEKDFRGAPPPPRLFTGIRGHNGYFPKTDRNKAFAIRFYPSRKMWRVFDLRKFVEQNFGHRSVVLASKYEVEVADLDAAIMFARLKLNG